MRLRWRRRLLLAGAKGCAKPGPGSRLPARLLLPPPPARVLFRGLLFQADAPECRPRFHPELGGFVILSLRFGACGEAAFSRRPARRPAIAVVPISGCSERAGSAGWIF